MTGRVKNRSPLYGFVIPDDGGPDVFTCPASCAPHQDFELLRRGDTVTFDVVDDPKHPGRVTADRLAWAVGAEPSLRELNRRQWREGTPRDWAARQRQRVA